MLEGSERGIAGAEIIERECDAERAQTPQRVDRGRSGLQNSFGQFDFDAPCRQLEFLQQRLQALDEAMIDELSRRNVDRDYDFRPSAVMPMRGSFDRRA